MNSVIYTNGRAAKVCQEEVQEDNTFYDYATFLTHVIPHRWVIRHEYLQLL